MERIREEETDSLVEESRDSSIKTFGGSSGAIHVSIWQCLYPMVDSYSIKAFCWFDRPRLPREFQLARSRGLLGLVWDYHEA